MNEKYRSDYVLFDESKANHRRGFEVASSFYTGGITDAFWKMDRTSRHEHLAAIVWSELDHMEGECLFEIIEAGAEHIVNAQL